MKQIAVFILRAYQSFFSIILKNLLGTQRFCRFEVTCSQYTVSSIEKYGILKGLSMGSLRLLKCQPFYNKGAFI